MIVRPDIIRFYKFSGGKSDPDPEYSGYQNVACPWHEDTRKSATINASKQFYNCHGCGTRGDVYNILFDKLGLTFAEADDYLNTTARIPHSRYPEQQHREPSEAWRLTKFDSGDWRANPAPAPPEADDDC